MADLSKMITRFWGSCGGSETIMSMSIIHGPKSDYQLKYGRIG